MRVVKLDVGMLTHDLTSIPAYARKVEALGYDCLWSAETQHDPFLPLAVAATVTSTIKLGTSIAVAFPRSPMILAHVSWDLAKASGGRFIMGLGSQMVAWDDGFCEMLAGRGFRVVRFDNRDVGHSTSMNAGGVPDIAAMTQSPAPGSTWRERSATRSRRLCAAPSA